MPTTTPPKRTFWLTGAAIIFAALSFVTVAHASSNHCQSPDDDVASEAIASESTADEPPTSEQCAAGVNAMAFELWGAIDHSDNATISPASISLAMSMILAGARGETADELAEALHLSTGDDANRCWAALLKHWDELDAPDGLDFDVANRLFVERSIDIDQDYLDLTDRFFNSGLDSMDFRGDADASRQQINRWVEDATQDRIQDLLSPGAVTDETDLVAVNAIYLLGTWADEFDPERTSDEPFHRTGGTDDEVAMMNQTNHFRYADTDAAQIVELPYDGDELSMVILLPHERDGLPDLEENLDADTLDRLLDELSRTRVDLSLPRFQLDGDPIDLIDAFRSLGVQQLFHDADLSGILDRRLFVNSIYHQAFIDVDEKGTEAAAATAVGGIGGVSSPTTFRADHPFLFMIRDASTGALVFMGRVGNP